MVRKHGIVMYHGLILRSGHLEAVSVEVGYLSDFDGRWRNVVLNAPYPQYFRTLWTGEDVRFYDDEIFLFQMLPRWEDNALFVTRGPSAPGQPHPVGAYL